MVKFDGKNITSASDLMVAVRVKAPGDTVSLTFNRDGKEMTADVTLGSDANSKPAIVQERQSSGF